MRKLPIALSIVIIMLTFAASAQKLPNTQKQSIHAPAKVKIDGKANEWDYKLQAYNHAIQVNYAVANDEKKLYLVIKTDKREIINKIINGGVSFTIKKDGKRNIEQGPTITYPVYDWRNHPSIKFAELSEIRTNDKDAVKKIDSLLVLSNNNLEEKAKYIRVSGIPEVDTLISIYNTDGIKAHCAIDNRMNYTLELSVELHLLGLTVTDLNTFSYNIKLNGVDYDYVPGIIITRDDNGKVTLMNVVNPDLGRSYLVGLHATDCWGTYTLVK